MSITPAIFGAITGAIGGGARTSLAQRLIREGNILTPTIARASGTTSLLDGITRLSNNVPASINRSVAGIGIPFYRVMPSCANLCNAQQANTNLSSNVLVGTSRAIVENSAAGKHQCIQNSIPTRTDGVVYWIAAHVIRGAGSRHCAVLNDGGANQAGVIVDLATGAATAGTLGNGVCTNVSSVAAPGGGWIVRCAVSSPAWGGTSRVTSRILNSTANVGDSGYTGDGTSSVTFTGVTFTANALPTHLLVENGTDLADNIQSQSIALPAVGMIFQPWAPYGKSWAAGVNEHGGSGGYGFSWSAASENSIVRTTVDTINRTDSAATRSTTAANAALTERVAVSRALAWDSGNAYLYNGSTLAATVAVVTAPWLTAAQPFYLGNNSALTAAANGIQPMPLLFSRILSAPDLAVLDAAFVAAGNLVGSAF